jgi:hypothetical protein
MRVAVSTSQCDFEPRLRTLSPFVGAHGAPTGLKVGCEGCDK